MRELLVVSAVQYTNDTIFVVFYNRVGEDQIQIEGFHNHVESVNSICKSMLAIRGGRCNLEQKHYDSTSICFKDSDYPVYRERHC